VASPPSKGGRKQRLFHVAINSGRAGTMRVQAMANAQMHIEAAN